MASVNSTGLGVEEISQTVERVGVAWGKWGGEGSVTRLNNDRCCVYLSSYTTALARERVPASPLCVRPHCACVGMLPPLYQYSRWAEGHFSAVIFFFLRLGEFFKSWIYIFVTEKPKIGSYGIQAYRSCKRF